eukprot:TRINITY_DN4630_c0_g1_i1.p1 TRINITY_DN4630_c0_g1~~TRINITY_DN4630_c0_g1_i1.p1  ORF type:complete len:730 (-),score=243.39 TRINITY_DN4630_c0_g1_i1:9-2198(-)
MGKRIVFNESREDSSPSKNAAPSNKQQKYSGPKQGRQPQPKQPKTNEKKSTVRVYGLPPATTKEQLEQFFGEIGPIRRCYPLTLKGSTVCTGEGIIFFSLDSDANTAVNKYTGKKFLNSGRTVRVKFAEKKKPKNLREQKGTNETQAPAKETKERPKPAKPTQEVPSLIVRNIPFTINEAGLKGFFSKWGKVSNVNIAKFVNGKMKGFAFIKYSDLQSAEQAVKEANETKLSDRPIAVDWAVAKDQYKAPQVKPAQTPKIIKEEIMADDDDAMEEPQSDHQQNESDEEAEDGESDEDDNESDQEDGDESIVGDGEVGEDETPEKSKPDMPDTEPGSSLFLRNLSFETTKQQLFERFKMYGRIAGTYIVRDPQTDRSKGMGFVNFWKKESADKAICAAFGKELSDIDDQSTKPSSLILDGRNLVVNRTVDKEKVGVLKEQRVPQKKADTRNLYLANEGLITRDSDAGKLISPEDMAKRERLQKDKKTKLQNSNFSVSRTRLAIRNIPKNFTSAEAKKMVRQFVGEAKPNAKILQCKLLENRDIAFVTFENHDDALTALRLINNNPKCFGAKRRPIVEFSIENAHKVKLHNDKVQRQKELARMKAQSANKGPNEVKEEGEKEEGTKKRKRERKPKKDKVKGEVKAENGPATPKGNKKQKNTAQATKEVSKKAKPKNDNAKENNNKRKTPEANERKTKEKRNKKQKRSTREDKDEAKFEKLVDAYRKEHFVS